MCACWVPWHRKQCQELPWTLEKAHSTRCDSGGKMRLMARRPELQELPCHLRLLPAGATSTPFISVPYVSWLCAAQASRSKFSLVKERVEALLPARASSGAPSLVTLRTATPSLAAGVPQWLAACLLVTMP